MPKDTIAEPTPQSRLVRINFRVHPELRKAIRVAAATADQSMEQQLHVALCQAYGRTDLIDQGPDAIASNAS